MTDKREVCKTCAHPMTAHTPAPDLFVARCARYVETTPFQGLAGMKPCGCELHADMVTNARV